jgi:hypothetical protein
VKCITESDSEGAWHEFPLSCSLSSLAREVH